MEQMVEQIAQADTVATDEISASEFFATAEPEAAPATQEPVAPVATPAPAPTSTVDTTKQADAAKTYTKAEFDAEVKRKADFIAKGLERKHMSDPRFAIAELIMNETGETDPIKAAEKFRSESIKRQAEQLAQGLKQDPASAIEQILQKSAQPAPAQYTPVYDDDSAARIADELIECQMNDVLPPDFDVTNLKAYEDAHPGFLSDAAALGVRDALLRASRKAVQQPSVPPAVQAVLAQTRALPQPIRPASRPKEAPVDYGAMSSADFARMKAWRAEQRAFGRVVRDN